MTIKGRLTFPKAQALEPIHQTQFSVIRSKFMGGGSTPLQGHSRTIPQPQPTRWVWLIRSLAIDVINILYGWGGLGVWLGGERRYENPHKTILITWQPNKNATWISNGTNYLKRHDSNISRRRGSSSHLRHWWISKRNQQNNKEFYIELSTYSIEYYQDTIIHIYQPIHSGRIQCNVNF